MTLDSVMAFTLDNLLIDSPVFPEEDRVTPEAGPYGPTGAEFTGACILPATTDVRPGVGYGAGAAEFRGDMPTILRLV